ncbi:hypothetical protein BV133_1780 [Blastochloris viridis]|uniref:Uncharacterized protein n=1 Tax=Blastochloris viridis TaxID=1079 RepID=A0A182D2H9_BLAVI|nr:hypothetical protein BV133_1780 [Blastochloris viridis]
MTAAPNVALRLVVRGARRAHGGAGKRKPPGSKSAARNDGGNAAA